MDELRDRFAALERIAVPDLSSDIDRRTADATAALPVHGQVTWRTERAPHRLSLMLMLPLLGLLLPLSLVLVTIGSRLPNAWTPVVPSPTPSVSTERITVGPAPAGPPQPGGIAYVTDGPRRGIVLADPSTGDTRPLTPPLIEMLEANDCARHRDVDRTAFVDDMTWSPDGRALAFQLAAGQLEVSDARPSCGLFVVSSDGQTLERVLPAPDWESPLSYSPAWARDGSRIAVAVARTIALVPLDGSDLVDLGRPCDGCQPEIRASIGGWSPDGSLIAAQFVDDRCCADDTTHYVAVVDVATAEWTLLWSGTSRDQRQHQWAPGQTGYQLVGWLHDGRVVAQSREGIFAADPDKPGEWVQLPFHGARDPILNPDWLGELGLWSPDKTRDALDWDNENDGLRVRHLATGRIDTIAHWILAQPLAWSPDGGQLVVVRGSARELWLIEADGANPRNLGNAMGNAGFFRAAWQPVWPEEEREP
jgi:hypothetical protein